MFGDVVEVLAKKEHTVGLKTGFEPERKVGAIASR